MKFIEHDVNGFIFVNVSTAQELWKIFIFSGIATPSSRSFP